MKLDPKLEPYRTRQGRYRTRPGDSCGLFLLPGPCGCELAVLFDDGRDPSHILGGWEHASVSRPPKRGLPNWQEMCFVKALFWAGDECVVQYHPPKADYTNNAANVLHLWRWIRGEFPRPPSILVGLKDWGEIESPEQAKVMLAEAGRREAVIRAADRMIDAEVRAAPVKDSGNQ